MGFDLRTCDRNATGLYPFIRALARYSRMNRESAFRVRLGDLCPILSDWHASAGSMDGHYFHQDLWAARRIFGRRPSRHIDIGSRTDGFVAHLLVFMPIVLVDIRPAETPVRGLTFIQDDAQSWVPSRIIVWIHCRAFTPQNTSGSAVTPIRSTRVRVSGS